jgi:hypothetical protein
MVKSLQKDAIKCQIHVKNVGNPLCKDLIDRKIHFLALSGRVLTPTTSDSTYFWSTGPQNVDKYCMYSIFDCDILAKRGYKVLSTCRERRKSCL